MNNNHTGVLPNSFYGRIARFEADHALKLEAEGDKGDHREILQQVLTRSGIHRSMASTIALDAGYSKTIDDAYLIKLGITSKKKQNIVYRELIRFHLGSLAL